MYLIYSRKAYDAMLKLVDRLIGWSENIKPQAGRDLDLSLSFLDESVQVKDWSTLLTSEPLDESEKGKSRQDGTTTQRGLAYDECAVSCFTTSHLSLTVSRKLHECQKSRSSTPSSSCPPTFLRLSNTRKQPPRRSSIQPTTCPLRYSSLSSRIRRLQVFTSRIRRKHAYSKTSV